MSLNYSEPEPKFFIGEIVRWDNKINSRYVKIVSIYKVITESNIVFFRYGGLKELDKNKWEHIEDNLFNIVFNENQLIKFNSFEVVYDDIEDSLNIRFEKYNAEKFLLESVLKPYDQFSSLFAINFRNTIDPKIKIKSIYESTYSNLNDIVTILPGHRYITDYSLRHHTTHFFDMEIKSKLTNWKEYRDVNTLKTVYVNNKHRLTSFERPSLFLTHDIDETDDIISSDSQTKWTKTFRKLIILLESKNCDHIVDIIKSFIIPNIKYSFGDVVYSNSFEQNKENIKKKPVCWRADPLFKGIYDGYSSDFYD